MEITELLKISEGKWIRKSKKKDFQKIKIDSREIKKNDAFLVIRGGYDYIIDAIENGASTIIVDREIDLRTKVNIIKVNNCEELLPTLAHYNRKKHDVLVIGVTGSVGKTSTKELIYEFLKTKYNVIKNIGNENNKIGLSKTLLNIDDQTDIVVIELGTNHRGEIHELSNICNPDVAIITNIGSSHIGNFGSKKEILKAKLEILDGMEYGVLLINNDDKLLREIHMTYDNLLYKVSTKMSESDLYAYNIQSLEDKVSFNVNIEEVEYTFYAKTKPMIANVLLAIQACLFVRIDVNDMVEITKNIKGENQRLEKIILGTTEIISDCYNASYESCINAFEYIKNRKKEKILILGDIFEAGKYTKKIHSRLGKYLRKMKHSKLLLVGDATKYIYKYNKFKSIYFKNNDTLKEYLKYIDFKNKIVLVKASHGMHLEEIVNFIENNITKKLNKN